MTKRILSIIQYVLFLFIGLGLIWWQLHSMTKQEESDFIIAIKNANYWMVIPIIIISIVVNISRSIRWKMIMKPLSFEPALKNVFSVLMIGYLINAAVPRLGEIVKCTFLAKYEKFPFNKILGTVIVEKLFDLTCYFIFLAITIIIQINTIGDFLWQKIIQPNTYSFQTFSIRMVIIIGIIVGIIFIKKLLQKYFPENKLFRKSKLLFVEMFEGLKTIKKIENKKTFFYHTLFIWVMYLLQIYFAFYGLDETSHLSIKVAFSVLSIVTLAMISTPGGIGSFPLFVMQILILYNIPTPIGKAFGWMMWGITTLQTIVLGLVSLILIPLINKHKYEIGSVKQK